MWKIYARCAKSDIKTIASDRVYPLVERQNRRPHNRAYNTCVRRTCSNNNLSEIVLCMCVGETATVRSSQSNHSRSLVRSKRTEHLILVRVSDRKIINYEPINCESHRKLEFYRVSI